jgi:hypothetical protein
MERSIFVESKVRAHPVVVGRVIRQQMTEVPFPIRAIPDTIFGSHRSRLLALGADRRKLVPEFSDDAAPLRRRAEVACLALASLAGEVS